MLYMPIDNPNCSLSVGFPKIKRWGTIWHHRFFSFNRRRQLNCRYHVPGYDVPSNLPARERTMASESAPLLNITALEILGEVWLRQMNGVFQGTFFC